MRVKENDIEGQIGEPSMAGFEVYQCNLRPGMIWSKYGLQQFINQLQRIVDEMKDIQK